MTRLKLKTIINRMLILAEDVAGGSFYPEREADKLRELAEIILESLEEKKREG